MKFTDARAPEIIRASQKDEYYLSYLRRCVADIIQSVLGPGEWIKWRYELDLIADLCYFGLTTVGGYQTLGEEYVNILQVDHSKRAVPSRFRRIILVLLHVSTPYLLNRLLTYIEKQLQTTSGFARNMPPKTKRLLQQCVPIIKQTVIFVHRCHLALFYIRGMFYHIAKRFVAIRYLLVRSGMGNSDSTNGFKWLGYFSIIQLCISLLQLVYNTLKHGAKRDSEEEVECSDCSSSYVAPSLRCPLCLERRRQSTATPCGHMFCWNCITEWMSTKSECPLCRDKCQISRLIFLQNYDTT